MSSTLQEIIKSFKDVICVLMAFLNYFSGLRKLLIVTLSYLSWIGSWVKLKNNLILFSQVGCDSWKRLNYNYKRLKFPTKNNSDNNGDFRLNNYCQGTSTRTSALLTIYYFAIVLKQSEAGCVLRCLMRGCRKRQPIKNRHQYLENLAHLRTSVYWMDGART